MSWHQLLIGPLHPDPNPVESHGVWVVRTGVCPWGDPFWHLPDLIWTPIWSLLVPFQKGPYHTYYHTRGYGVPLGCHPVPKGVGNGPKWGPKWRVLGPIWPCFGIPEIWIAIRDRDDEHLASPDPTPSGAPNGVPSGPHLDPLLEHADALPEG